MSALVIITLSIQLCLDFPQGFLPALRQLSKIRIEHRSPRYNDNIRRRPSTVSRYGSMRISSEQLPQQPLRPVPLDRSSDSALCDAESQSVALTPVGAIIYDKIDRVDFCSGAVDPLEITLSSDSMQGLERELSHGTHSCGRPQTVRRFLPLRRRRLITACPPLVFIRERKPCVFFRRRLFG